MKNILSRIANWYFSRNALPYWCILLIDYLIIIFCGYLAYYILENGHEVTIHFWPILQDLCILLIPYTIAFRVFHTYSGIFRYSSFVDLGRLFSAMLLGTAIASAGYHIFPNKNNIFLEHHPRLILLLLFATFIMAAVRIIVKTMYDTLRTDNYNKRIFIYGVQNGGISLAKSIRNETPNRYTIKGFISPDNKLKGKYLMGLPVYSDEEDIVTLMRKQNATTLMVSPLQTTHFREQETLINTLIDASIKIMMMPYTEEEWDGKSDLRYNQLHEVDIEDLLPRDKIEVNMQAIGEHLNGSRILITGAAGSIGSNGSVIPLFKEQIIKGGPITVTHPDIIRYFMLIPEACKLVLEAGTMGKGGEIFVFDMGKPVRIADLAQRMINLSGAKNCKIKYTGLRNGEKLYEEVLNDAEQTLPTKHPKIMIAKVREYDYDLACKNEERLLEASYTYNDLGIVKIMKEIVPEYKSQHSKYQVLD